MADINVFLVLFLVFVGHATYAVNQQITKETHSTPAPGKKAVLPSMCSRVSFEALYPSTLHQKTNKTYLLKSDVNETAWTATCSLKESSTCYNKPLNDFKCDIMAKNNSKLFLHFRGTLQPGCYGYVLTIELELHGNKTHERRIIHTNSTKFLLYYAVESDAYVTSNLYEIPSGRVQSFSQKLPGKCLSQVMHRLLTPKLESCHPIREARILLITKMASGLCERFNKDHTNVGNHLIHEEINKSCPTRITTETLSPPHPDKIVPVLIAIICGVIFTATCILIACFWRLKHKQCTFYGNRDKKQGTPRDIQVVEVATEIEKNQNFRQNESPTVMILNRPGCELIETLLRDLAFILKSYGIKVNLSLLEQAELDAAGGISSYLQRNIDQCDYILVMFSEYSQDQNLTNHKPYDFALKVITGLMYHENDTSRYIMMYLDPFKTAMHYIPTVFHATQDYGYRIPKDLTKLAEKVCGQPISPEQHSQRELKNKLFNNRMKSTIKKLQGISHDKCHKNKCFKGKLYASVSNLSSVWATTVHSKWASANSLADNAQVNRESVVEYRAEQSHRLRVEDWTKTTLLGIKDNVQML